MGALLRSAATLLAALLKLQKSFGTPSPAPGGPIASEEVGREAEDASDARRRREDAAQERKRGDSRTKTADRRPSVTVMDATCAATCAEAIKDAPPGYSRLQV
jgi:hypothetical protein